MFHLYENPDGLSALEILQLDTTVDDKGKTVPAGTVGGVRLQGDKGKIADVIFFDDASGAAIAECAVRLDKAGLRFLDSSKREGATRKKKAAAAPEKEVIPQ